MRLTSQPSRPVGRWTGTRLGRAIGLAAVGTALVVTAGACGGDDGRSASGDDGTMSASASGQATPAASGSAPTFQADITGAVDRAIERGNAISGAKYGRYHINLAADAEPVVVIAFGRGGESTPEPGTYSLGGDGFGGTLEVYGDPQREFQIDSGELEITGARGDALSGRYSFVARELDGARAEIRAEGTFQTRAQN